MTPGTFTFHLGVPVDLSGGIKQINIPVDTVIMPKNAKAGNLPLLMEAKSAGDFTNPNKRKERRSYQDFSASKHLWEKRSVYSASLRLLRLGISRI